MLAQGGDAHLHLAGGVEDGRALGYLDLELVDAGFDHHTVCLVPYAETDQNRAYSVFGVGFVQRKVYSVPGVESAQ